MNNAAINLTQEIKSRSNTADLFDLVDNLEAATLVQCSPNSLRLSRHTGLLFGVPAPAFLKMGRKIRYRRQTLEAWLAQFDEVPNTAASR